MALSDGLTGLANRRNFDLFLEAELRRATSLKRPLSLIMFDLNRFKSYNDTYGHLTGDKLLTQIGQILRENVQSIDFPARYGGEEFSIILPECSNAEAAIIAENIRRAVELSHFPDNQGGFSAKVSASLGVATYNQLILPTPPSKELNYCHSGQSAVSSQGTRPQQGYERGCYRLMTSLTVAGNYYGMSGR